MSSVSESRSETRQCDVCEAKHTSSLQFEQPSNAKWVNYPWRKVEMADRKFGGALSMCLDICSPECMLTWIQTQLKENFEFVQLVRIELDDIKRDQT